MTTDKQDLINNVIESTIDVVHELKTNGVSNEKINEKLNEVQKFALENYENEGLIAFMLLAKPSERSSLDNLKKRWEALSQTQKDEYEKHFKDVSTQKI